MLTGWILACPGGTSGVVWFRHGYFGSTMSRQNTIEQSSIKLAQYADEEYHESTITYKTRFTLEEIFPYSSILEYSDS